MASLIRRQAPTSPGPGKGLGYLYAQAGTATGQAEQRARTDARNQQFTNFGLGLAGQAFGSFLGDRSYDHRLKATAEQQAALKEQDLQHRQAFIQELESSNPDIVNHPAYQRLKPGVEQGLIKPQELPILMEAHDKGEAERKMKAEAAGQVDSTKRRGQDLTAEDKAAGRGIQQQGMDLRGLDTASRIDNRTGLLDVAQGGLDERYRHNTATEGLGQQRVDESGRHNLTTEGQGQARVDLGQQRLNQPKTGAIINDPEYRDANDTFVRSMKMADAIERRIEQGVKNGEDTSLLEERLQGWHQRAMAADQRSAGRLKALQGGVTQRTPQSPTLPAVTPQDQRNEQAVPHEDMPQKDHASAVQDAFAELGPSATNDQIKQWLTSHGY